MKNINLLIEQVLNDSAFCDKYTEIIIDNDNYIQDNYEGVLREELLLKIIQESSQNEKIARFLSGYVVHLSQAEVKPRIFDALLSVYGKYRESILIGLSHCELSYYQLIELNKLRIDEALIKLIQIVFKYDCFSKYDLMSVLSVWDYKIPQYVYKSFSVKEQSIIKKLIKHLV